MTYAINTELNGIEVLFESKPTSDILQALKGAGFRWHKVKKIWYAKQTADRLALVKALDGGEVASVTATTTAKAAKKAIPTLWERCKVDSIPEHDKHMTTKDIAAETRKHIKERFPEIKFSCRIGSGGWSACNEINFYFKSAPFEKESIFFEAVRDYVKAWLWSYNYDNSDSMTDYFDRGFYENISTWDFTKTEPTEAQKEDMQDFIIERDKFEEEEAARREAEYIKQEEERAKAAEAWKIREAENKKKVEEIEASVRVEDLTDNEIILTVDTIAGIGKENNTAEIIESNNIKRETAIISRKLYFNDEKIYSNFCNLLMYDFTFLQGKGGTGTLDNRVTKDNYTKLNSRQREAVAWCLVDSVAVYLNNSLKLIVDPEGYSYARYVDIVTGAPTYKPLHEAEAEEETANKEPFVFPAPLAEQAEKLEPGQYTIISVDPWACSANMKYIDISAYRIDKYAQYNKSLYIDYTEAGKRKPQTTVYREDTKSLLIYPSFVPAVPDDLQREEITENMSILRTAGAGVQDFLIDVYNYYKSMGILPTVNTLQF